MSSGGTGLVEDLRSGAGRRCGRGAKAAAVHKHSSSGRCIDDLGTKCATNNECKRVLIKLVMSWT